MDETPTNGELLKLVNAILSGDEQIPRNISNAAIMAALMQMNLKLNTTLEHLEESKKKYEVIEKRVETLERNSIVAWIGKHPKSFTAIMAFIVLLVMFAHELSPTIVRGIETFIKVTLGI